MFLADETIDKIFKILFTKEYIFVAIHIYKEFFFQQFQKLKFPFHTIELENRDDCNQIQAVLGEMTGATSVSIENIIKFFLLIVYRLSTFKVDEGQK